jgi:hypothetical protein
MYSKIVYSFNEAVANKLLAGKTVHYPVFGKIWLVKFEITDDLFEKLKNAHKNKLMHKYFIKPAKTAGGKASDFVFELSDAFISRLAKMRFEEPHKVYNIIDGTDSHLKKIKHKDKY